jgi:hypothetical protein
MRQWVEGEEEEEVWISVSGMQLVLIYLPLQVMNAQPEFVNWTSQLMLSLIPLLTFGPQSQTSVAEAELVTMTT